MPGRQRERNAVKQQPNSHEGERDGGLGNKTETRETARGGCSKRARNIIGQQHRARCARTHFR